MEDLLLHVNVSEVEVAYYLDLVALANILFITTDLMCGDNIEVSGVTYCKPCASENFDWTTGKCSSSLVSDVVSTTDYCAATNTPPDGCTCQAELQDPAALQAGYVAADKLFFGRGAIQLSW